MDINSSGNGAAPAQPVNLLEILNQMHSPGESGLIDRSLFKSLNETLQQHIKDATKFNDIEVEKSSIILDVVLNTMSCKNDAVTAEALCMLGNYLDIEQFSQNVSNDSMISIVNELCILIKTTCNKDICTRALLFIQKGKCFIHIHADKVDELLAVMSVVIKQTNLKSFTAQNECINIIKNLLINHQEKMCSAAEHWMHDLAPFVNHPAIRVRASTLTLIDSIRFISEPSKEIIKKAFLEELSLVIIPIMKDRFFKKQDTMMLILWCHICDILGTAIHQGTVLLNSLLEIVEKGFKSPEVKIKVETFHAWRHLIDNFAFVPDVICNSKRLQLLLRPMLANNAQSPVVAKLKFTIWWHLVSKLGPKLSTHFQLVCNPFILFCFTHELPRNTAEVNSKIGPNKFIGATHQFLHELGTQAICQLLCGDMREQPPYEIATDLLNMPAAVGAELLMSYSDILLNAVEFITKDANLPREFTQFIWKAIEHHLQNHSSKPEVVGIFNHLVQVVASVLNSSDVRTTMKLKIFGIALNILSDMPLPTVVVEPSKIKVLPVYILMKSLLNQQLLTFHDVDHSCYLSLFKKLLHIGVKSFLGALGCCSLIVKNILKAAEYTNDGMLLSQLWTEVSDLMLQYMSDKGDMNEGDSLGHDFTCCYEILLFPYLHIFSKDLPEKPKKEISKKCDHLYAQFLSSVALVENVGVNTCVEELFEKMFATIPKGHFATLYYLEELLLIIGTMIKSVDWHQLSQISSPPARKSTKRHRFGNLVPIFAEMLSKVLESIRDATTLIISSGDSPTVTQKKIVNEVVSRSAYLVELIVTAAPNDILLGLLTNLTAAVELFLGIATSLKDIFDLNDEYVLYMWNGIISALTRALDKNKQCPSSYFASIAPLMRAALTFPHEEMKKITFGLWKNIRSRSSVLILIPPLLRNAFEEMEHAANPASTKTKLPSKNYFEKTKTPVKSKNILENDSSMEFVAMPAPKKTKIYTEHQLEQMRSKKFIPAMYSDLTQDSSSQKLTETHASNNKVLLRDSGSDDACDAIEDSQLMAKSIDVIRNKATATNLSMSNERVEIAVIHGKPTEPEATISIAAHADLVKSSETSTLVPARPRNLRKNPRPSKRRTADNVLVGNVTLPLENLIEPETTNGKIDSSVASTPHTRSRSLPPSSAAEDAKWGSGILKKRKSAVSTLKSSPPKRRVVSFADSVDKVQSETINMKAKSAKHRSTMNEDTDHGVPAADQITDSQTGNRLNPVFPKLVACNDPVNSIVPRLSPSMWTRGLNQFLKARNVVTVGDLSKMSSAAIEELPVKSPKLLVVRKVLSNYFETWNTTVNDKVVDQLEEFPNELDSVDMDSSKPCEEPTPLAEPTTAAENVAETDGAPTFKIEKDLQPLLPPVKKTGTRKQKRGAGPVGYKRLKKQMWTRHKGPTKQDPRTRKPKMKKIIVKSATHAESCVAALVATSEEDLRALSRTQLASMMLDLHKISGNILNALLEKDKLGE